MENYDKLSIDEITLIRLYKSSAEKLKHFSDNDLSGLNLYRCSPFPIENITISDIDLLQKYISLLEKKVLLLRDCSFTFLLKSLLLSKKY
jgi:hypothetical protein